MAATFINADLDISALARATLGAGVGGAATPTVLAPLPWLLQAVKATGARMSAAELADTLRSMGQLPGSPPNVGGYPGAATWLASSATAARFSAAIDVARATPDEAPALAAAQAGDWSGLADLFMRPAGFSDATITALEDLKSSVSARPGEGALALALASPDLLIA